MSAKSSFEEWEDNVVRKVEETVENLYTQEDIKERDVVASGDLELWGGAYKTVPYWRCQPYFRPVNGVTGDKRVVQS